MVCDWWLDWSFARGHLTCRCYYTKAPSSARLGASFYGVKEVMKQVVDRDVHHICLTYSVRTGFPNTRYHVERIIRRSGQFEKRSYVRCANMTDMRTADLKAEILNLLDNEGNNVNSLNVLRDNVLILSFPDDFEDLSTSEGMGH